MLHRLLFLLAFTSLALGQEPMENLLVFRGGKTIKIQSEIEIRGNKVLFTRDGNLMSLPAKVVDLEASHAKTRAYHEKLQARKDEARPEPVKNMNTIDRLVESVEAGDIPKVDSLAYEEAPEVKGRRTVRRYKTKKIRRRRTTDGADYGSRNGYFNGDAERNRELAEQTREANGGKPRKKKKD